jgi:hypothetical protein
VNVARNSCKSRWNWILALATRKGKEKSEEGKRKTWTFSLFLAAGDQLRLSFPARFCFSRLVEFNAIQNVQNGIVFYFKKWSC